MVKVKTESLFTVKYRLEFMES